MARKTKVERGTRLVELVQVNPDLVVAIIDWVDQDEKPEPAGAESLYYPSLRPSYRAANAHLQTLLELRLIKGMTPDIIAKLSKVVTVYPQEDESKVNVNTVGPLEFQDLDPRITSSMASVIIQARPFITIDDLDLFRSFEDFWTALRLNNSTASTRARLFALMKAGGTEAP